MNAIPPKATIARSAEVDHDPAETQDWLAALESLFRTEGAARARFILDRLERRSKEIGILDEALPYSAYRNTIPLEKQPRYPGDLDIEERITSIMRWNALAMVVRANKAYGELGGHIASYASAAEIFEVGFNHFFTARRPDGATSSTSSRIRRPASTRAPSSKAGSARSSSRTIARRSAATACRSYPHPWLMPDFWQFPTGSMGIGPISAIYQARFMRYLDAPRDCADTAGRHVWGVFGDGEMDEPESIGGLTLAARENLDNLTFVINCNLQRLDGPVRGNGQIIQELESLFAAPAGTSSRCCGARTGTRSSPATPTTPCCAASPTPSTASTRRWAPRTAPTTSRHFFGDDPELRALVAHMIRTPRSMRLKRGGHDFRKLYAAFAAAQGHQGPPDRDPGQDQEGLRHGRGGRVAHDRPPGRRSSTSTRCARSATASPCRSPTTQVEELRFYEPAEDSAEMRYLRERREALGGVLPAAPPHRADRRGAGALDLCAASRWRPTARRCRPPWRWCACSATC